MFWQMALLVSLVIVSFMVETANCKVREGAGGEPTYNLSWMPFGGRCGLFLSWHTSGWTCGVLHAQRSRLAGGGYVVVGPLIISFLWLPRGEDL
jgi:hypothetical protein